MSARSRQQGLPPELEAELAQRCGEFFDDPLGFVMWAFDWGNDPALRVVKLPAPWCFLYDSEFGPDGWFCELLERVAEKVKGNAFDPLNPSPVDPVREAITSGHGIGKSAGVGMLVSWIMSTRPHCKGTVTATTNDQLYTKTWAQIATWARRCITGHWFDIQTSKGNMLMRHRQHPTTWYCAAQSCDEKNAEAFAGQHAVDSTSFYVFDEASGVPDSIYIVSTGGLTDGEPMVFAFGNPTRNTGWFAECFRSQRHRWNTQQIDSRDVQITNKKYIQEYIDDYGIDSDRVKIRVRGMFPSLSSKQFFDIKDIDAAYGRHLRAEQYNFAPKILTLDNSWEGDDETVFGLRQGLKFEVLRTLGKNDNDLVIAKMLADFEDEHGADAVFVDGGYGTGVVSAGRTWGRDWTLVWFAGESSDPGCFNKRAAMYSATKQWLKAGGAIPKDQRLYNEMMWIETKPRDDGKLLIESKKDMKKRLALQGGASESGDSASPNRLDSLVLSFAYPVQLKNRSQPIDPKRQRSVERQTQGHDPYSILERG